MWFSLIELIWTAGKWILQLFCETFLSFYHWLGIYRFKMRHQPFPSLEVFLSVSKYFLLGLFFRFSFVVFRCRTSIKGILIPNQSYPSLVKSTFCKVWKSLQILNWEIRDERPRASLMGSNEDKLTFHICYYYYFKLHRVSVYFHFRTFGNILQKKSLWCFGKSLQRRVCLIFGWFFCYRWICECWYPWTNAELLFLL